MITILQQNKFHYLYLFGIRVSTCDTSLPDDIIGGIRVNKLNLLELVVSKASTEPSPKNLSNLFDAEAVAKGGAAFVKEGEYAYYYVGRQHPKFKPLPAFAPKKPVPVYRWKPSNDDIKEWNKGKGKPLSASFAQALKDGKVRLSTSTDTMIHKTWGKEKLFGDSAGCQVMTDDSSLIRLGQWADNHRSMKYPNLFTYTLFTKEQFIKANTISQQKSSTTKTTSTQPTKEQAQNIFQTIMNFFRR